jgi:hypothetical protein
MLANKEVQANQHHAGITEFLSLFAALGRQNNLYAFGVLKRYGSRPVEFI